VCIEDIALTKNRFVTPDIKKKYDLDLPEYEGIDQVVEVNTNSQKL
jgi:NAD(P)H-hydrate epimerase